MNASPSPSVEALPNEQEAADLTSLMAQQLLRHDFNIFELLKDAFERLPQKPRGYASIVRAMEREAQAQQSAPSAIQLDLNRPLNRIGQMAGIFLLCTGLGAALLYLGSGEGSWVAFGLGLLFLGLLPFVAWFPFSSPLCPCCGSPANSGSKQVRIYEGGILPIHQCRVCTQEFYIFHGLSLLERREEAGLVLSWAELKERGRHWRRTWALTPSQPEH